MRQIHFGLCLLSLGVRINIIKANPDNYGRGAFHRSGDCKFPIVNSICCCLTRERSTPCAHFEWTAQSVQFVMAILSHRVTNQAISVHNWPITGRTMAGTFADRSTTWPACGQPHQLAVSPCRPCCCVVFADWSIRLPQHEPLIVSCLIVIPPWIDVKLDGLVLSL